MQYTSLGDSGIQISRIVHGCMELGGGAWDVRPDAENAALLHTALEHGVTAFDTAESYGGGHSEEVVGRTLAPLRDKVVLCTKVSKEHLHKKDVLAACEGSLRRLRTDYIDLYYIHWPNPDIEIGETMEAFELLKAQGKIRAIGVSNFSVAQMRAAQRYARLDALQPEYNLLCRGIEDETLAELRAPLARIAASHLDDLRRALDHGEAAPGAEALLAAVRDRGDYLRPLLGKGGDPAFAERIKAVVHEVVGMRALDGLDLRALGPLFDYYLTFAISAEVGVLLRWLDGGMRESVPTMARLMTALMFVRPGDLYDSPIELDIPSFALAAMCSKEDN